ncbi:MAG: hypothetical protein ACRYF4_10285 [Janthinobacterium lividum]
MKSAGWYGTAVLTCCTVLAGAQSLAIAKKEARSGRVDAAVTALKTIPRSAQGDALLCALYGSVGQYDQAVVACEAAAADEPSSSTYALALARAYGAKADHAGAITGLRLVGKIRSSFERAVTLDGNSVEALSDLGQFYVEAPGAVGGGLDRARALLPRLKPLSAARTLRLSAMIAAKSKDNEAAEQNYQSELTIAHSPEAYVDLANFYRSRKDWDKAAANAKAAITRDVACGPDVLDAAGILIALRRDLPAAQTALRCYLREPQAEVASYAKAYTLLGDSLRESGDAAGARTAYQDALALAQDYAPARQGLTR